jgi:uncharacterized membrane protein
MLAPVTLGFTLLVLLVNLLGLSVAALRLTRCYALARVASPALLIAPLFLLEHFIGLGSLAWVWPLTTGLSAWLIWKNAATVRENWRVEAFFLAGFGWALIWRFAFPDLDASSEKLTDLGFINNYLAGARLPPVDRWFPPYAFDVYYGLQYYASALAGRIFGLQAGLAYHLSFCALVGMASAAAGETARLLCGGHRWRLLPWAAFLLAGTGASPLLPLLRHGPALSDGMRFIGATAIPGKLNTPAGRWLLSAAGVERKPQLDLPAETFGYLTYLGDLHPPMGGFLLLALSALALALIERGEGVPAAQAALCATAPLSLAVDAWNFPLQCALVAAWAGYRLWNRTAPDWRACAVGVAAPLICLWPFLQGFAWHSLDYNTAFRLVLPGEHTPPLLGFVVLYPLLGVLAARLLARDGGRFPLWLAGLCALLLVVSELFFVDDVYSGPYNRFNTTLKWWPWISTLALLVVGSLNLASKSRICRAITVVALGLPTLFAADLVNHFILVPKPHAGRLTGDAWITSDPTRRAILEYLRREPPSIVLQRPALGSFTESPALTMFANQTSFLGWPAHERLWRGGLTEVDIREEQVRKFYRGELDGAADWLVQNRVGYVLWLDAEKELPAGSFEKVQAQIGGAYYWREYRREGGTHAGVWSRRLP